jgi:hypothetical protein
MQITVVFFFFIYFVKDDFRQNLYDKLLWLDSLTEERIPSKQSKNYKQDNLD